MERERPELAHIPEHVRKSLDEFVNGILNYQEADVRRIILYGSLAQGNWKPEKSDIDMAVVVENDPRFANVFQQTGDATAEQRQLVICGIHQVTDLALMKRFHVQVCVVSDLEYLLPYINDGRGPLSEAIKRGIPLYEKKAE